MSLIGKVIGALLGFLAAKIPGAIVGLLLGHQFDRGLGARRTARGGRRRRSSISAEDRQRVFFETTFLVMGHLAKADGRVSEADIAAARDIMQRMRLGEADTRLAMELFNRGKAAEFPYGEQVSRFNRYCGSEPQLVQMLLEIQIDVALVADAITPTVRELLCRAADLLGVGRLELVRLESALRARRRFAGGKGGRGGLGGDSSQSAPRDPSADLEKAYEALGLAAAATDAEVKTAYRRLMNEHHPDKQASRGLPPALLKMAEERTREIRLAYETIRDQRGFR
jgi:DnaJ like chaperone protein